MKIYCYLFKIDGTVQKEIVKARKRKTGYSIDWIVDGKKYIEQVEFNEIGTVLRPFENKINEGYWGCKTYLETDMEITDEMKQFSKERAKKIQENSEVNLDEIFTITKGISFIK